MLSILLKGVTILGAGILGLAGLDEIHKDGIRKGQLEEKAKHDLVLRKLNEDLIKKQKELDGFNNYEKILNAMIAMGVAAAQCDGVITDKENEIIDLAVGGVAFECYPSSNINKFKENLIKENSTFATAMEFVKKIDKSNWCFVDLVIDLVLECDEKNNEYKSSFRELWRRQASMSA